VPRHFLTAEDVRRASGREIVVDESTVVTPQAHEAAQAAGILIRDSTGSWAEPAPDRGPDAPKAASAAGNLPEPELELGAQSAAIVTAVGKNRAGVLAEITAAIAAQGGNVHDVSQKVVEGFFHMVLTVELGDPRRFGEFKQCLECLGSPEDFAVRVMHERVFRFMHRI
jgi:ACT domain-containing protein